MGYLISNRMFYGVFIIEVFLFSIFLFYNHKIIKFLVYSIEGNKYTIPDYVDENYDLIYEDKYIYEHKIKQAKLYQLKDLSSKE